MPIYLNLDINMLQLLAVGGILVGMIMLLLGIHRLFNSHEFDNPQETSRLKKDIEERKNVISGHSIFHQFLARNK